MKGNVNNNFQRVTNQAAHNIRNNPKDDGQQTSNKLAHYDDSPNWKGRITAGGNQGDPKSINRVKPPLVTKGLVPLNSSFIMNKTTTESIPPVPTNDSAALAAMMSMPPPQINNGCGNDSSGKQEMSSQTSHDKKNEMSAKADAQTAWSLLHEYWTFVQENPYDFNGWSYLLSHVESMKHIEAARSAFEGFLPLYPYCFAYWKKLADLELKYSMFPRCLGVLIYGTKSVPLCHDIWISLFTHFKTYAKQENLSVDMTRLLYKVGLERIGMSWHSSPFWEECINFEIDQGDFLKVMTIYKWLISIPIKVYNKHWDQLVAIIRDNHPQRILSLDVFDHYYRVCCDQLKIKYVAPQQFDLSKPPKIDDQVVMLIKEKILAGLIKIHEENAKEVEKRWKLEDKIKRPYFHVKPIEKKQLKAWNNYLDFEIRQGDPIRILVLFERCLVSCAQYEEMWCRYASFLEEHARQVANGKYKDTVYRPGCFSTDKDEAEVSKSGRNPATDVDMEAMQKGIWFDFYYDISEEVKAEGSSFLQQLCDGVQVGSRVLTCPTLTAPWILQEITFEDVRQVYRRASWIHCPSKPLILMQWAEFEESQGDIQTARDLLNTVLSKHPQSLKARIQLIDLERRGGMLDRVEELYTQAFSAFKEPKEKSFIAIRFARFLFKFKDDFDTALALIRKALKKDKGNVFLYNQVFNICYEKRPVDCDGVLAAVMLALASKELSIDQKRQFCLQREQFLREHGTISQIKDAQLELSEIESQLDSMREEAEKVEKEKMKQEELKKKEQERLEKEQKEKEAKKAEELRRENAPELGELTRISDDEDKYVHSRRNPAGESAMRRFAEGDPQIMDHDSRKKKRRHKRSPSPRSSHGRRVHDKRRKRSLRNEERSQNNRRSRGSIEDSEATKTANEFLPPPPHPEGILTMKAYTEGKITNVGTLITSSLNQALPMNMAPPSTKSSFMKNEPVQFSAGQQNMGIQSMPPGMFNEVGMQRSAQPLSMSDPQANHNNGILGEFPGNQNQGNRMIPPLLSLSTIPPNQIRGETPTPAGIPIPVPGPMNSTQNQGQLRPTNPIPPQGQFRPMQDSVLPPQNRPMNPAQIQRQMRPMNPGPPQRQLRPMSNVQPQGQIGPMHSGPPQGQLRPMNSGPPQGQLRPMNSGPPQAQIGPMNSGPPQGQLRPMLSGPPQGQLGPMNSGPPQGQLGPMNSGPPQGQLGPMNSGPPQGQLGPMNSGPPQGQLRPMNNGPPQGQLRPLNNGPPQGPLNSGNPGKPQGSLNPMNLGQSQGSTHVMNPGQSQGPLNPMSSIQSQGPLKPMNPVQSQGPVKPMNPVQSQGPVRPFNPPGINRPPFQAINLPVPRNVTTANGPVVNVPDWLITEGGELRLSTGPRGDCILKYWPKFMNEMGHDTLLSALRKSIKWLNQKLLLQDGQWVELPMMLSWLGPCEYKKDGVSLGANSNWPPEMVDLLHTLSRVCEMGTQFNSCLLRLYRNGYDHQQWDSEEHPAMNTNPKIALVSVGAIRQLEMRHKNGSEYIRFPLLPGSLLFMEGATQADWIHQITKDPKVGGERISLSFRTMLMINGLTV